MVQTLLHHTLYFSYLFLTFILITQVNNLYQVSSRLIKNIPGSFRLRFLKIADITVFLLFFIQNSRYYCFCCFSFKIYCFLVVTLKKTLDLNIHL